MRRKDREVTTMEDMMKIMEACDVCRIAINHGGYPYIVPLNFGIGKEGDRTVLYFHSAMEGMKVNLIAEDNRAGFEMDYNEGLVMDREHKNCSIAYRSVMGRGHIEEVPDEEKYDALCCLMGHYHQEEFPINEKMISVTKVYKLVIEEMTGKARR